MVSWKWICESAECRYDASLDPAEVPSPRARDYTGCSQKCQTAGPLNLKGDLVENVWTFHVF